MKNDGLGNDNTYFQNKTKMNRTKSPPETGSANLISTQIQERSKTVDTSRETTLAQRTEQNLGHKICCWPIFWKAEEQPRCVRTGESWNLILDSWESKKLLKHPDCSGCWQCSLQNCFQAEHFFFFPSENANSLQWKHSAGLYHCCGSVREARLFSYSILWLLTAHPGRICRARELPSSN